MIEIHHQGAVIPKSGYLRRFVTQKLSTFQEPIPQLCLYETRNKAGQLQTGRLGTDRRISFSQSYIAEKPSANDIITVDKEDYTIESVINRNYNIGFLPFWECDIRSVNPSPKV